MPPIPKRSLTPLGAAFRAARIAAGYKSGREAATKVGVKPNNWSFLELHAKSPSWPYVVHLIYKLNLGLEHFFRHDIILAAAARIMAKQGKKASSKPAPKNLDSD
jgi:hypothetical protein